MEIQFALIVEKFSIWKIAQKEDIIEKLDSFALNIVYHNIEKGALSLFLICSKIPKKREKTKLVIRWQWKFSRFFMDNRLLEVNGPTSYS